MKEGKEDSSAHWRDAAKVTEDSCSRLMTAIDDERKLSELYIYGSAWLIAPAFVHAVLWAVTFLRQRATMKGENWSFKIVDFFFF